MIIGLTGKYCCGKGMAVEHLQSKGFVGFSLSDMLREQLKNMGKDVTRDNLIEIGNKLRKRHGPGVLGKLAREKIDILKKEKDCKNLFYVDSIRNPFEVKELKKDSDFVLVYIQADQLIRFQRMLERKREKDPEIYEEFKRKEKRESEGRSKYSQRLDDTISMVDFTIKNEGTLKQLHKDIDKLIKEAAKNEKTKSKEENKTD